MGIFLTPPSFGTRCCPSLPTFKRSAQTACLQRFCLYKPGRVKCKAALFLRPVHPARPLGLLHATPMLRKLGRTGSTSPCGFMATCFRPSTERSDPSCAHFTLFCCPRCEGSGSIRFEIVHGTRAWPRPRKRSSSSGGSRRTFPDSLFQITLWYFSGPESSRSST